ncbi:MAG: DNA-binding transcriptional regulator OxyR [Acidobacteriota bacterium]|nr:DNA-binding transcriptional regulator OxyR [Blastocatellia bacterium]MDW8412815.1 DNA-binding transcriptional regulator OxyR [Acidobacteriota bacterium]
MINLRDLVYFLAVVDKKHFGKAAEACFVSQPALSMQLKKLEEMLGVQLFERNSRQVIVTPIGQEVAKHARIVLQEVENIRQMAQQARDPFAGEVRIGIIPTIAPYLLPLLLPKLTEEMPKLRLLLQEGQTQTICKELDEGQLDAVVLALPIPDYNFIEVEAYREPFYLAVSPNHPLAGRRKVSKDDLEGELVLLLEDGHCLREQALEVCKLAGAIENTSFRATSLETLRHMVAVGAGITLVPELAVDRASKDLVYIRFKQPVPARTVGVAYRRNSPRKVLFEKLVALIRRCVAT